jgi:Na+-translocating ferredoxin:NAD+ oxidoreductase RnfA subunit
VPRLSHQFPVVTGVVLVVVVTTCEVVVVVVFVVVEATGVVEVVVVDDDVAVLQDAISMAAASNRLSMTNIPLCFIVSSIKLITTFSCLMQDVGVRITRLKTKVNDENGKKKGLKQRNIII